MRCAVAAHMLSDARGSDSSAAETPGYVAAKLFHTSDQSEGRAFHTAGTDRR